MPNTHRRRRRDETVELRRVVVDGVYMSSQLTTTADGFGDVNAAVGRDPVYSSAANPIEVGYDVHMTLHVGKHSNQLCSVIFVNFYNFLNTDVIMSSRVSTGNYKLGHDSCVASAMGIIN